MPAALPYTDYITQAAEGNVTYRVNEVQYGNGYAQAAPDGLNNELAKWSISWGVVDVTIMTALMTAFKTAAGVDYFTWQPPGDTAPKKFIIRTHRRRALSGDYYEVSAELEQRYML